jgi:hypothetical protein
VLDRVLPAEPSDESTNSSYLAIFRLPRSPISNSCRNESGPSNSPNTLAASRKLLSAPQEQRRMEPRPGEAVLEDRGELQER